MKSHGFRKWAVELANDQLILSLEIQKRERCMVIPSVMFEVSVFIIKVCCHTGHFNKWNRFLSLFPFNLFKSMFSKSVYLTTFLLSEEITVAYVVKSKSILVWWGMRFLFLMLWKPNHYHLSSTLVGESLCPPNIDVWPNAADFANWAAQCHNIVTGKTDLLLRAKKSVLVQLMF